MKLRAGGSHAAGFAFSIYAVSRERASARGRSTGSLRVRPAQDRRTHSADRLCASNCSTGRRPAGMARGQAAGTTSGSGQVLETLVATVPRRVRSRGWRLRPRSLEVQAARTRKERSRQRQTKWISASWRPLAWERRCARMAFSKPVATRTRTNGNSPRQSKNRLRRVGICAP